MRTFVVCIDGTWNDPSQRDWDRAHHDVEAMTETNVLRTFRFLKGKIDRNPPDLRPTMIAPLSPRFSKDESEDVGTVLYLSGVGTNRGFLARQFEGLTGVGTLRRILDAYRFLAQHCRPEDQIFGFGFSRGAFAVRSLAGMLHHVGLPASPRHLDDRELDLISLAYRGRTEGTSFPRDHRSAEIQFLGLWDTVGALAFDGAVGRHDTSPPNVRRVAHALALDEQRVDFTPDFWAEPARNTLVNEVWFAGAHSNIGGGYQSEELSNIALAWIISEAMEAGLPEYPDYIQGWSVENTHGFSRDSYDEFLRQLRIIGDLMKGAPVPREIPEGHGIHASVFDRIEKLETSEYLTGGIGRAADYTPSARFTNGRAWPTARASFGGRIVETPDYLSRLPTVGAG